MIKKALFISMIMAMLSGIAFANGEDIPRLYSTQTVTYTMTL